MRLELRELQHLQDLEFNKASRVGRWASVLEVLPRAEVPARLGGMMGRTWRSDHTETCGTLEVRIRAQSPSPKPGHLEACGSLHVTAILKND